MMLLPLLADSILQNEVIIVHNVDKYTHNLSQCHNNIKVHYHHVHTHIHTYTHTIMYIQHCACASNNIIIQNVCKSDITHRASNGGVCLLLHPETLMAPTPLQAYVTDLLFVQHTLISWASLLAKPWCMCLDLVPNCNNNHASSQA